MRKTAHPSDAPSPRHPASAGNGVVVNSPLGRGKLKASLNILLTQAREAEYQSVENLAAMAGVTPDAIRLLEEGRGPVATLAAVMQALPFQVSGLGKGRSFTEQLRNRRMKMGLSPDAAAARASLQRQDILDLEAGGGCVENLLRLLAVIGPKIYRRKMQRAHWSAEDTEESNSRFTPASFLKPLCEAFGKIDVDPCGHPASPVEAGRRFFVDQGDDGLADPWFGKFAYVNPPFSGQLDWLRRASDQFEAGNVELIVVLVPTRTDSAFFHETIRANADLYFLRSRLKFASPEGKVSQTPHSLMLVVFGATAAQRTRFEALVPGFWILAAPVVLSRRNLDAPLDGSSIRHWHLDHLTDADAVTAHVWSCSAQGRYQRTTCRPDVRGQ